MDERADWLRIATVVGVWAMVVLTCMNTCGLDRLEQQIIANRRAIEAGGFGQATPTSSGQVGTAGQPGDSTGIQVRGWGGRAFEITHVEGAWAGAPLLPGDKPKAQGDTYVQRQSSPPSTMNYFASNEGLTRRLSSLYSLEGMLRLDPEDPTQVLPWLATRWEISEDGLTYTYHLRRGVLFADGRPFTSKDVAFSFAVLRDPEVNAQHLRAPFEQVESLTTPDDHTVVVRYRTKDWRGLYTVGYHLKVLDSGWFEEHIPAFAAELGIEEFSIRPGSPGFGAVFNKIRVPGPGTGPYYLDGTRYNPDAPLDLVQNPAWWGTQVRSDWFNFAKLRTIFITDDVAAFEEFRKGRFDVMVVDASAWDDQYSQDTELLKTTNYHNYDHMGIGYSSIIWNARQPPFDDARVRRAMAHLVDRQWILDEVQRGRGWKGYCPGKPAYAICKVPDFEPLAYDPDRAKQLLAEAGWVDSDGDGVLDRDGVRFEFEIKVGSPRRFYTQVAGLIKDSAAQVGIRVSLRTLEWATFIEDFYARRFDSAILYNSFADPWISPRDSFHSSTDIPRGRNASGWRNQQADSLLDAMVAEFDDQKRIEMYWDFVRLFQTEQPQTILHHGAVSVLQNNRFEDVRVLPTGLRIQEYWTKPENVKHQP
ncbi:MAG: hypothetical protein KTR31_38835 [Myxococcales bacterium]|nr:hypothetical protein [Myxococcales bacterium]